MLCRRIRNAPPLSLVFPLCVMHSSGFHPPLLRRSPLLPKHETSPLHSRIMHSVTTRRRGRGVDTTTPPFAQFLVLYSRAEGGGSTKKQRQWREGVLMLSPSQSILWMKEEEETVMETTRTRRTRRDAMTAAHHSHLVVVHRDRGSLVVQPSRWWRDFCSVEERTQRRARAAARCVPPHRSRMNSPPSPRHGRGEGGEGGGRASPWCAAREDLTESLPWRPGWSTTLLGTLRYRIQILEVLHLPEDEEEEEDNEKEGPWEEEEEVEEEVAPLTSCAAGARVAPPQDELLATSKIRSSGPSHCLPPFPPEEETKTEEKQESDDVPSYNKKGRSGHVYHPNPTASVARLSTNAVLPLSRPSSFLYGASCGSPRSLTSTTTTPTTSYVSSSWPREEANTIGEEGPPNLLLHLLHQAPSSFSSRSCDADWGTEKTNHLTGDEERGGGGWPRAATTTQVDAPKDGEEERLRPPLRMPPRPSPSSLATCKKETKRNGAVEVGCTRQEDEPEETAMRNHRPPCTTTNSIRAAASGSMTSAAEACTWSTRSIAPTAPTPPTPSEEGKGRPTKRTRSMILSEIM